MLATVYLLFVVHRKKREKEKKIDLLRVSYSNRVSLLEQFYYLLMQGLKLQVQRLLLVAV